MSECDHRIGQYEEPGGCVDVHASQRADTIRMKRAAWKKAAQEYVLNHGGGHQRHPFFDKRAAMLDDDLLAADVALFKFCPDCGEKLR